MPPGTTKERARHMLQTMLAERFGLRFHRGPKQLSVYALGIGKGGFTGRPAGEGKESTRGSGTGMLTAAPSRWKTSRARSPVAAKCRWWTRRGWPAGTKSTCAGRKSRRKWAERFDGGLIAAIERQLGLKLERKKLPYDMLVIDRLEKTPTAT